MLHVLPECRRRIPRGHHAIFVLVLAPQDVNHNTALSGVEDQGTKLSQSIVSDEGGVHDDTLPCLLQGIDDQLFMTISTKDQVRRLERELAAARKEIEDLKTDRAILKKAAAFFAKENE